MSIEYGCTRIVILTKRYAFKIPQFTYQWRHFLWGLICNMSERNWSRSLACDGLCPIVFSLPGGWLNVMLRARPLTRSEWFGFDYASFVKREDCLIPVEEKMDSFVVLDGNIVAVDYGETRL